MRVPPEEEEHGGGWSERTSSLALLEFIVRALIAGDTTAGEV